MPTGKGKLLRLAGMLLFAGALPLGCGGRVDSADQAPPTALPPDTAPNAPIPQSVKASTACTDMIRPSSDGASGAPFSAATPPLACSQAETGLALVPNAQWLLKRIVGRWLLCSPPSAFGTSDEVGLEFTGNGEWYKLYVGKDGRIVRGMNAANSGYWEYANASCMNGPGSFQLTLSSNSGADVAEVSPVFTLGPRKMVLIDLGEDGRDKSTYAIDP